MVPFIYSSYDTITNKTKNVTSRFTVNVYVQEYNVKSSFYLCLNDNVGE